MTIEHFSGLPMAHRSSRQLVVAATLASALVAVGFDIALAAPDNARLSSWIGSAQAASKAPALSTGDAVVIQASDGNHYYATVDRLYQERGVDMVAFSWQAGNRFGQGYMPLRDPGGNASNPKLLTVDEARGKQLTIANDLASTRQQASAGPGAGNSRRALPAPENAGGNAGGGTAASGPSVAAPQDTASASASGPLTAAERKDALAAHARWRSDVGVGPLDWSETLATSAQDWAEHIRETRSCRIDASAHSQRADIGENLAYYSPVRYSSGKTRQQAISATRVVNDWGSEKRFYDYPSNSCSGVCGHYTQVVWQDTKQVGCGRAVCQDQSQVWVCQYTPPGNYTGQKPY